VINYGLTGVMARSVGLKRDVRIDLFDTYANYYYLNFKNFIGINGDSYDRFLIRVNEMTESLNIITQIISKLITFNKKNKIHTSNKNNKNTPFNKNKIIHNYMNIVNFDFNPELDPKHHYIENSKIIKSLKHNNDLPLQNYALNYDLSKFTTKNNTFNLNNMLKINSVQLVNKLNKKILNKNKYNNDFKYMENIINHFKY
jgi:hypothetical protein